jgi:hypothetical protein
MSQLCRATTGAHLKLEIHMPDLAGVGTPITFSEDNPISRDVETLKKRYGAERREPKNDQERQVLARWLAYRGRDELECIVGSASYAYTHFAAELDSEWRLLLADHIRTEAGHGWGYIQQANALDPSYDHAAPDPEFVEQYGLTPRTEHLALQQRDFLSFLIAGNMWPYGFVTSLTIQNIKVTTPKVVDFETRVVEAEEHGHHDAALQKVHDYAWSLIDRYGKSYIQKRIAEIDAQSLNARSRTVFDPPRREFLRQQFNVPFENAVLFIPYRKYLYENVLGWTPEAVTISNWPEEVPVPVAA